MLRHIAIVLLGLFGDQLEFLLFRLWAAMLLGALLVVVVYWLAAPAVLSIWPGVAIIVVAIAVGIAWEVRARDASDQHS